MTEHFPEIELLARRLTWWSFYKKVIVIFALAFAFLLFGATAAEPNNVPRIRIMASADSVIRQGFEGAKTENAFCIRTHMSATGRLGWVTKAWQADTVDADSLGLNLKTPCPDGTGLAHWHLDNAGYTPEIIDRPSWQDIIYTSCMKDGGEFHLIVTKRGYFAYNFREERPPCSAK